jgi:hypothetical protein
MNYSSCQKDSCLRVFFPAIAATINKRDLKSLLTLKCKGAAFNFRTKYIRQLLKKLSNYHTISYIL